MTEQEGFFPAGLSTPQATVLCRCVHEANKTTPEQLLQQAEEHLEEARELRRHHPLVNVRLAEALVVVFRKVVKTWDNVPAVARPWLRGAMGYFIATDDEEPDFTSPLGFEDDVDVLNACLRLAGRDELCLNAEDYD